MRAFGTTVGRTIRFDYARSGFRTFSSQAVHKSGSRVSVSEKGMRHSGQDRRIVGILGPNGGTDRHHNSNNVAAELEVSVQTMIFEGCASSSQQARRSISCATLSVRRLDGRSDDLRSSGDRPAAC